jgi:hypothetical protein
MVMMTVGSTPLTYSPPAIPLAQSAQLLTLTIHALMLVFLLPSIGLDAKFQLDVVATYDSILY